MTNDEIIPKTRHGACLIPQETNQIVEETNALAEQRTETYMQESPEVNPLPFT